MCSPRRRRWRRAFPSTREAVAETVRLAERLRFDLSSDLGYRYPGAEDEEAMRKLTELCQARLRRALPRTRRRTIRSARPVAWSEELRIIESLGLPGFFLLHHDMLELAREVAVEVRGAGQRPGAAAARAGAAARASPRSSAT